MNLISLAVMRLYFNVLVIMKEVNIYIKESCDSKVTKSGYYIAIMTTTGGKRKLTNSFSDTTNYRMIIQGAIDAISMLNQPCIINLFTNTAFGMSKIRKSDGTWREFSQEGVNMDLLNKLKDLIITGGHEMYNFYEKNLLDEALVAYENDKSPNHIVLRLHEDVCDKLYDRCKQEKRSVSELIESLVARYLG